jgi:hypothetical protein
MEVIVRPLKDEDKPYAMVSMRESHHQGDAMKRIPWPKYKQQYGVLFWELLTHDSSKVLGAYHADTEELVGFLVGTPGKSVHTLHWVQVKFKDRQGNKIRRQGIMLALLAEADLGSRFVYTLRAGAHRDKHLDEKLAQALLKRGLVAAYTPIMEWLQ